MKPYELQTDDEIVPVAIWSIAKLHTNMCLTLHLNSDTGLISRAGVLCFASLTSTVIDKYPIIFGHNTESVQTINHKSNVAFHYLIPDQRFTCLFERH